jgi:hypothetical protein
MVANARPKATKTKTTAKTGITYAGLRKYNFIAAFLYLIQGIVVLILSNSQNGAKPITVNFLTNDKLAGSVAGHSVTSQASHQLFGLNLAYVIAAFFFVSALTHLIVSVWKRKVYEADLKKGTNRARWIDYSFSVSIMMVAIALLAGIYDLASLIMIFALTAAMSLLGMGMELRNVGNKEVDWANYYIGVGAGLVPWLVFAIYIWSSHLYGSSLPGFVYWVVGSLFILFCSFAVNMYLQYKRLGNWSTYLYGERAYIVLSFVAKTALAWQVFAGTLR